MKNTAPIRSLLVAAGVCALTLGSGLAQAQGHGGGGGGHGGGAVHAPAAHAGYGYRGGYGYGYRGGYGGYGYRGYGWRGGYWGGWGPWGWGGLGLGLYFASLPLYYSTYWWDGVPYYYADNTYYLYDGNARQYVTVAPPPEVANQAPAGNAAGGAPGERAGTDLIAYPKNGQSAEQQAKDKYECHHWATTQSGFDPTLGASEAGTPAKRSDYMRAQAACLDGRGYSVQ